MQNYIRARGHETPADWTTRAYARNYDGDNDAQSEQFSEEEISAILDSDVFIHLSDLGGKGKYVDFNLIINLKSCLFAVIILNPRLP